MDYPVGPPSPCFLDDGRVAIDNNAAERGMRPIGVGRRNWLFAGSDTGGETLARAMTVIETAKMNGIDPQAYLTDILSRIHYNTVRPHSALGYRPPAPASIVTVDQRPTMH
ncbi:Integrase core domain-containing protein [Ruegeria intermedia]|uniref:Integrase core domain-containing protein n=1 Tax=Ruegeria intermedia TaxID=996115 RepID=A0A1M5B400_9RHOB|nr:Integrase core domain-containing protein [Ruegeria intermedia]